MNAKQRHQNWKLRIGLIVSILFLAIYLCFCASEQWSSNCNDRTVELFEGYEISKGDTTAIKLVQKDESNEKKRNTVISNYFVTGYQTHEPYVCLMGIHTWNEQISKYELNTGLPCYYLVDCENDTVTGFYHSYAEFDEYCKMQNIQLNAEWTMTTTRTVHHSSHPMGQVTAP